MNKNVIEDLMTLVASGKSVGDSMADMIMGSIRAESDRKEVDRKRHKQICGNKFDFETEDMVKYLKYKEPIFGMVSIAYYMGFITKDGEITKKGEKFLRNNA